MDYACKRCTFWLQTLVYEYSISVCVCVYIDWWQCDSAIITILRDALAFSQSSWLPRRTYLIVCWRRCSGHLRHWQRAGWCRLSGDYIVGRWHFAGVRDFYLQFYAFLNFFIYFFVVNCVCCLLCRSTFFQLICLIYLFIFS